MDSYKDLLINSLNNPNESKNSNFGKVIFSVFSSFLSFLFILGLFNDIIRWGILIFCFVYFIYQLANKNKESNSFWSVKPLQRIWFLVVLLISLSGMFNLFIAKIFVTYMSLGTLVGAITIHFEGKKINQVLIGIVILAISIGIILTIDR